MSSSNADERNVGWALKTFRPLLKDLKIQQTNSEYRIVECAGYKIFQRYNMRNSAIAIKSHKFKDDANQGFFVWQYDEEEDFYLLYIIINEKLCGSKDLDTRIKLKTTGIHEFLHCAAAMMVFSRLQSKVLRNRLHENLKEKLHALNETTLKKAILKMSAKEGIKSFEDVFPDDHFRLKSEEFPASYSELARNLLLSYDLFTEPDYMNENLMMEFKKNYKENKFNDAGKIIIKVAAKLSKDKALDINFVLRRIIDDFIKNIL